MTRDIRLLTLSLFTWGIGEGLFFYFQPIYLAELGADPIQIGFILGLAGAATVLTHVPAGAISDRWGPKSVIVASWVLGMLAAWVMFLAPSLGWFVAGLVLYYLTLFVMSPLSAFITASRGRWTTSRALTTVFSAFNLGVIIGPATGGWLAESMGLRNVFAVSASIFVVSTVFALALRPMKPAEVETDRGYRGLLAQRKLIGYLGLILVTLFAMYLSWPLTPNFLTETRGVELTQIGVFGSINALGVVLLNLTVGRTRPKAGMIVVQGLVALSVMSLWRGQGLAWYGVGYWLAGAFKTGQALYVAHAESLVSARQLGFFYGLVETAIGTAMVLAAPAAGVLYNVHPWLPYPASLVLLVVSLILTLRFLPAVRPAPALTASGAVAPTQRSP